MPCYSLIPAWWGTPLPSGKRSIVFKRPAYFPTSLRSHLEIPCGQCIGCRLEYSRQWAMRCMHEAALYKRNCFLTLTYDPEHLPLGGSLEKRDFQLFMKRLRKKYGEGIRFYGCGEYGEQCLTCGLSRKMCFLNGCKFVADFGRPHYHILLFNFDFDDKVLYKTTDRGDKLYNSVHIDDLWPSGYGVIGDVTFESAAYVARYVMKKFNGDKSDEHYLRKSTGEILPKEFVLMSRGSKKLGTGGIGKGWYRKFATDVFPSDYLIVNGKKCLPPKFYSNIFELDNPFEFAKIKALRKERAKSASADNSLFRLAVKEEVRKAQIRNLSRRLDK